MHLTAFVAGNFEHVGVAQTSAADARAVQDHHAFEDADLQNAVRADGGEPEIFPVLPVGLGEIFIVEAFAFFEDEDGISFFGEAHGGDTSPEARADDDEVVGHLKDEG